MKQTLSGRNSGVIWLVLILLVAFAYYWAVWQPQRQVEQITARAIAACDAALQARSWDEALRACRIAVAQAPANVRASQLLNDARAGRLDFYYQQGEAHLSAGETAEALAAYNLVFSEEPAYRQVGERRRQILALLTPTVAPNSVPVSTTTPVPTATPTSTPSPIQAELDTPTSTPSGCSVTGIFQPVWQPRFGCPMMDAQTTSVTVEHFERGFLVWVKATDRIYLLAEGTLWREYRNPWQSSEDPFTCDEARNIGYPVMGFGKIWCQETKALLGQPLGQEIPRDVGYRQAFASATLLLAHDNLLLILAKDGSWSASPK